jgi:serine/threonine protein kinase
MTMRCPNCRATYDDDARFCTQDGGKLVPVPGTAAPAAPPPAAPAESAGADPQAVTLADLGDQSAMLGKVLDGAFRIERKLGEGGMSYVYLGEELATGARYAIKILAPNLAKDATAMARLRREALLGGKLAHRHVCHIVKLGETAGGLVYVVMPYVQGEILSDRNHRVRQTSLADTVTFVGQIAAGLQVAHDLTIVHRDLKPENIMICKDAAGQEFAVIMDFGLAKARQAGAELQKLTSTGIVLGTPEFMSPEQLRGKPLDGRTDIYSLALMAFEMLTGKLPFEGRNQQEMMIARLRSEPTPIRKVRSDLPSTVEAVLLTAMARAAEDRYATAPAFAEALRVAAG